MKKAPFKMKGYSYPGKSPLHRDWTSTTQGENVEEQTEESEQLETSGLSEVATEAVIKSLISQITEKKEFEPINIAGEQSKIM